jgi:hypothetical protein
MFDSRAYLFYAMLSAGALLSCKRKPDLKTRTNLKNTDTPQPRSQHEPRKTQEALKENEGICRETKNFCCQLLWFSFDQWEAVGALSS